MLNSNYFHHHISIITKYRKEWMKHETQKVYIKISTNHKQKTKKKKKVKKIKNIKIIIIIIVLHYNELVVVQNLDFFWIKSMFFFFFFIFFLFFIIIIILLLLLLSLSFNPSILTSIDGIDLDLLLLDLINPFYLIQISMTYVICVILSEFHLISIQIVISMMNH